MSGDAFEGFANRETWLVQLLIAQNPYLADGAAGAARRGAKDQAERCASLGTAPKPADLHRAAGFATVEMVSGWLAEAIDRVTPQDARVFAAELIRQALDRCDHTELGAAFLPEREARP